MSSPESAASPALQKVTPMPARTKPKKKRTVRRRASRSSAPPPPRAAIFIVGATMPVFSVAFSGIAGMLWLAEAWVACAVVACAGISGLVVSLEHVAKAIRLTTGSGLRPSWMMAIGFELGIVGLELAVVTAPSIVVAEVAYGIMVALALLVGGANILTFDAHRHHHFG